MRRFCIAPTWNIGVFGCPVSSPIHRIRDDKVSIGGENMTTIGQCRGVNQHIFAGFNQARNIEYLSGRQIITTLVQSARQDNLAHA
ncbi:Uncharacterised protein [Yersinia kristensenii]|nr:Uncharacterised protein [Yersinia kristensenii]